MGKEKMFKPMLGCEIEHADISGLTYPLYGSPKYDGIRGLVTAQVRLVSRSLEHIPSRILKKTFEHRALVGMEGELIYGHPVAADTIQRTVSAVMSQDKDELAKDVSFYVFDIHSLPWEPFEKRYKKLLALVSAVPRSLAHKVKVAPQKLLKDPSELMAFEEWAVGEGYEGIILKDPKGKYKYGRSTQREQYLLKLKRFKDGEAEILEVEELLSNQNEMERDNLGYADRSTAKAGLVPAGMLGSFTVRDTKTGVEFSVGSGPLLTKEERIRLWKERNKLKGMLLKYQYQPAGVKDKPRFPTAVAFRDRRDL